ncbi:helix-turn-helix transcriptional regulator [Polaribacter sejongensis]|nr:helix-turn-helix transcriptional regulator [Polaribacter undariae]UWD31845.1 helix-turn-helix transcriptional regulator [Polaribacter undariae]
MPQKIKRACLFPTLTQNIDYPQKVNIFTQYAIYMSEKVNINRLKVVLAEKNLSSKWLAEQLEKNEATVSRWCTNDVQPPIKTFLKIAEVLDIKLTNLFNE